MHFMNDEHENFYNQCMERERVKDSYHKALFYTLGLTDDCRRNINALYDFREGYVKQLKGENYGWITGTDRRIIRLAYNLYNCGCPTAYDIEDLEEKIDETMQYIPTNIFGYLSQELIIYCLEAIKIAYEIEM